LAYIPGLSRFARVGKLDPDLGGPGLGLKSGIEKGDAPLEHSSGIIGERHRRCLSDFDKGELVFIDVGRDPDMGQVGNGVELIARVDMHPSQRDFLDHRPALRCMDGQGSEDLTSALQVVDVVFRNIPELQPPARHLEERFRPFGYLREGAPAERALTFEREQIFCLRGHQLRAVEREQLLAFLDLLPRGVHEEVVDPTLQLDIHMRQAAFINLDLAHGADDPVEGLALDDLELDANGLKPFRAHRHDIYLGSRRGLCGRLPVLSYGRTRACMAALVVAHCRALRRFYTRFLEQREMCQSEGEQGHPEGIERPDACGHLRE
jgi:hypothetical protein